MKKILLVLLSIGSLWEVSAIPAIPSLNALETTVDPSLLRRAGRSKCSAPFWSGEGAQPNLQQRDLNLKGSWHQNGFLEKRMRLPGNDIGKFIMDETDSGNAWAIAWEDERNGASEDVNTASFESFSTWDAKPEEFSYATSELKGCTTLVIISRKGVYMAHYWENIAFAADDEWLNRYKGKDNNEKQKKIFQATVIDGLTKGRGPQGNKFQVSLKENVAKIDDDHIVAYLMRPNQAYDDRPGAYSEQWAKIKSTVVGMLPKLGEKKDGRDRWQEVEYTPVDSLAKLKKIPKGRVLFKYDPKHKPDKNSEGKKRAMLWIEDNPAVHEDEW